MAEADISIPSPSVFLRKSPPPIASAAPPIDDQPRASKFARKAGTAPKKATFQKSGSSTTGEVKQKQSKSRNGCVTCKAKRLKCDEEKPTCQQCAKRKVECGGYRKDFKWRPFEETNVKLVVDRQKRPSPPRQVSGLKSQNASPPPELEEAVALPIQTRPSLPSHARTCSVEGTSVKLADLHLPAEQGSGPPSRDEQLSPIAEVARTPTPANRPLSPLSLESKSVPISGISTQIAQAREQGTLPTTPTAGTLGPFLGASPTLTDLLHPFTPRTLGTQADYISFSMPEDFQLPLSPLLGQNSIFDDISDQQEPPGDATALSRSAEEVQLIWQNRYTTPPPSRSSDTTVDTRLRTWGGADSYLYDQPYLPEDSMEMLSIRFDKLTCGILSVMDGPNENPWRTLMWPLAQDSPALLHALLAMTAFHSASDVPSLRVVGHEHKDKSFVYIQEGIRDRSMTDQKAIATALALGFTESWDQHTATGNSHIKGAQVLVKRTLAEHQTNPLTGVELARLKFLVNAWVYMDVIARLTSVDSDYSNDFDNTFLFSSEPPDLVMGAPFAPPGFGIDFGIGIDARIDPLMGCSNTLFPLIGRVANLVKRICRSTTTSPSIIAIANELKSALEMWQPPSFIEPPEDSTSPVQHSIQTAEAYRWATLLHLHRAVPELPSPTAEELSQKSLSYLATVPLTSRTTVVHLYPLFIAGCEAAEPEDREFVRGRWAAISARKRTGAADKAAIVTEEVWRRKDAYRVQSPSSRNRLVETAQLSPVRRHGEPLKRTRGGFEEADPGRKGMVYTWVEGFDDEGGGSPPGGLGRVAKNGFPPRPRYVQNIGGMEPAYTVRGHLHWVGVCWDWGWESKFTVLVVVEVVLG
ncbi:hypothetical protein LTR95_005068 [Oleoguttula sp. CCFEE 5521]